MTSNDNYVTIEIFNKGIQEIKSELKDIKTEIRFANNRIDNMAERLDDLKFFGTIGIGIIAIFTAIVALLPQFVHRKTEESKELSQHNIRDIRALIREEITMAQRVTNAGK